MRSRVFRALFVCAAIAGLLIHKTDSTGAVSGGVVISQVYGGGGNAGATWKNDFIELFNRGSAPVSLAGMSVQYASAAGTTWQVTPLTSVTLAPGQYYLVQEAVGAGGTTNLPAADATGTIAMSATAGKVALSATTATLSGACPSGVVDVIGYNSPGASGCFEGTNGPALTNTTAALRAANGCTDTDNNGSDFSSGAPNPRNTATAAAPCSGTSPSGTIAANAASYSAGDAITLTVTVTPGTNPASTGLTVTGNLGSIGLGTPAFSDQGGNTFAFTGVVPTGLSGGTKSISASITDAQARSATTPSIPVTILAATSPTATGSATPASVPAGGSTQLTVSVTPGSNPASTGLTVTGDLSLIGGGNLQAFQAGPNNTFTFQATVDGATSPGSKALPITVTDDQARGFTFTLPLTITPPLADSTIVMSQIYGGGGNSNATYLNDYVQLYNRGNVTVDLTGWSLQYASATGTSWTNKQPLGGPIAPGQYYLVALASGGSTGAALPAANIIGQINMSATTGKIALVDNGDTLTGPCPLSSPHVKDFVGYGASATCHEGTANAPAPSNTTAIFRQGGGFVDTNDNGGDFVTGPPAPVTTAPIVEIGPAVLTTDPLPGATTAPRDLTIDVTFTEAVDTFDPWFDITCATSGSHNDATTATAPGARDHFITPNANFTPGETCTVTVFKDRISDQDTDDSGPNTDHLPADYSWSFSIATGAAPPYPASVHLTMGNPSGAAADFNQPNNYLMEKPEYALSYNRDLGRPNWVSWHLTPEWFGTLTRVDTFRPDPEVPPDWYRVQSFDFQLSGFDRGHMTPNADRDLETSIPINQATYLMSNMVAQAPDNNQGPWANLENYLRSIAGSDRNNPSAEIYIVSGPAGVGGTGSNGGVTTTLANGHVTVPAYTWKVALVLPFAGGDDVSRVSCQTRTIAVIMPNVQGIRTSDPNDWMQYLTTVDAVESLTGLDLFSNVPPTIQNCIQAGVNGVNPDSQTIAFAPIVPHHVGDADFAVDATASSGLPVTLTVTSGPATIAGGLVHLTGAGTVTIRASQPGGVVGSTTFARAVPVDQTFDVEKATPAFSALSAPSIEAGTATATVSGVIGVNGLVPSGSVGVTLGATTLQGSINPSTGAFSVTFTTTGSLSPAGSPYAIALSYPGDAGFAAAAASSTLTVADTTAPTIALVGPSPLTVEGGTTFVDPGATAADSFAGNLTAAIQATGTVNTSVVGSYTRTYTVSDGYNTASTTRTVNVVDTIPPVITLTGGADVTTPLGSPWVDPGATAQDSRAGNLTAQIVRTGTVNTAAIGAYTLTYTVSDGVNSSTAARTVHVVDGTGPVISHLAATPNTLFFPTNTLWPVIVSYDATDNSGAAVCSLGVTSNDDDLIDHGRKKGQPDPDIDFVVVGPHLVLLRAEKEPRKDPALVYTITVTCSDPSHNTSTAQVGVNVRKR